MIERIVRGVAIFLSVVIAAGFGLFALDEMSRASTQQTDEVSGSARAVPSAAGERERERRNGSVRELIDDANDVLLAPFSGIADDASRWVQRIVPSLLGLLLYGFLLAYLARFARGRGAAVGARDSPAGSPATASGVTASGRSRRR